jgi:hypothetical protein
LREDRRQEFDLHARAGRKPGLVMKVSFKSRHTGEFFRNIVAPVNHRWKRHFDMLGFLMLTAVIVGLLALMRYLMAR